MIIFLKLTTSTSYLFIKLQEGVGVIEYDDMTIINRGGGFRPNFHLFIFLKGKIRVRVEKLKKNKYFPSFRGGGGPKKRWKIPSSSFFFLNPTLIELSDSFGKPY